MEAESRRIEEKKNASHHSTKYKGNLAVARNHGANVQLAETEADKKDKKKDKKKTTISTDEVDHRPDVIDTSPTLRTISQAR